MAFMILMILFIAASLGIFGFAIFKAVQLVKHPMPKTINYPLELRKFLYLILGISASTIMVFVFLSKYQNYNLPVGDWFSLIFGSLIFGATLSTFVLTFFIHLYAKDIEKQMDLFLFIHGN